MFNACRAYSSCQAVEDDTPFDNKGWTQSLSCTVVTDRLYSMASMSKLFDCCSLSGARSTPSESHPPRTQN